MSEDEDLGIKIGTPEEAFWTDLKKRIEKEMEHSRHELIINSEVLKLAERKLEEEKEKI